MRTALDNLAECDPNGGCQNSCRAPLSYGSLLTLAVFPNIATLNPRVIGIPSILTDKPRDCCEAAHYAISIFNPDIFLGGALIDSISVIVRQAYSPTFALSTYNVLGANINYNSTESANIGPEIHPR